MKKVKFRTWLKVVKLYVKMKLLTSYFQKYLPQGHLRWPEFKNRRKKFNFKLYQEYTNYTSKWSSWRHIFQKMCRKAIQGHPRSESQKKVKFLTLSTVHKFYVQMNLLTRAFENPYCSPEVNQGHHNQKSHITGRNSKFWILFFSFSPH